MDGRSEIAEAQCRDSVFPRWEGSDTHQMDRQDSKVIITARDADGNIVKKLEVTPYEWYDGDEERPLIDSDEERLRLSVRSIEGYQTNSEGKVIQRWRGTYHADGRLDEMEEIETDWKPSIPPPPPGQSAADQLRRLGIFQPKDDTNKSAS